MYSYVIRMSFVCTRMSFVCHSSVVLPWTISNTYFENHILYYQKALKKLTLFFCRTACHPYVTCMSFVCYLYTLEYHSYVTRMYSYVILMWLVCSRMLSVCHSYVLICHLYLLVCHAYVTSTYSQVIRMSLVCTRMSSLCHSYVLVCHPYVTCMYSYVIRMSLVCTRMSFACPCVYLYIIRTSLVCGFTMNHFYTVGSFIVREENTSFGLSKSSEGNTEKNNTKLTSGFKDIRSFFIVKSKTTGTKVMELSDTEDDLRGVINSFQYTEMRTIPLLYFAFSFLTYEVSYSKKYKNFQKKMRNLFLRLAFKPFFAEIIFAI